MALPTAQLGSMASLNIPSSIPVVEKRNDPKLWQQVLLGLISAGANAAIGQGVENAMSQDFAGEFGETPESGMMKAVRGPRINRQQAESRRDQAAQNKRQETALKHDTESQATDIQSRGLLAQLDALNRETGQQAALHATRMGDLDVSHDRNMQSMQDTISKSRMQRRDISADRDKQAASLASQEKIAQAAREAELMRTAMQVGGDSGLRDSQTRKTSAEATGLEQMNQLSAPKTGQGTSGGINPNIAASRKIIQQQTQSKGATLQQQISELLAQGLSPDEIADRLMAPTSSPGLVPDSMEEITRQIMERRLQEQAGFGAATMY